MRSITLEVQFHGIEQSGGQISFLSLVKFSEICGRVSNHGIRHRSMMPTREALVPVLCVLLLWVVGTAFCADGKQRATAIDVDADSDDDSTAAGSRVGGGTDYLNRRAAGARLPSGRLQQA